MKRASNLLRTFRSGSTCLVSLMEFNRSRTALWQLFKDCFSSPHEPAPGVRIPPGAPRRLLDIRQDFRDKFRFNSCEDATFTQMPAEVRQHRDAFLFPNGAAVLLPLLAEGQNVLRLSSAKSMDPGPVQFAHVR